MKIESARYFFTVVTYKRRDIFCNSLARDILKDSIQKVRANQPFDIPVFCLLPNHIHCIWKMPAGESDYSSRWGQIKQRFSKAYIASGGREISQTESRINKRERGIWQRRFWEHRIRDDDDYWNHVHYIHRNPLKHGLVKKIVDWPYSSYHRFYKQGVYTHFDWESYQPPQWGEDIEYNE